jgi:hypothetical protein
MAVTLAKCSFQVNSNCGMRAVACKLQHFLEFGAVSVLAGHFVGEGSVNLDAFELPVRVLAERADPYIADSLSCHKNKELST